MKYDKLDLGTVEAVFNKLGGIEGAKAFLRGNQKLTPSAFERNEHGHVIIEIEGLDLTGAQEVERLLAADYRMDDWAKSCLTSKKADSYDKNHRLEAGKKYKIVLMPATVISTDSERTTDNLRKKAIEFGYQKPLAGIVPRIRESVSDEQMKDIDVWYIAALHDPIKDSDGERLVLFALRDGDGRGLETNFGKPGHTWRGFGCFAFLLSAS
jgi:hypothetical protein